MKGKSGRWWWGLLVLSLLLSVFDHFNLLNWIKGPVNKLVFPLRVNSYQQSLTAPLNQAGADQALLEAQVTNLTAENERLRDLLGAPLSPKWQFIPVSVLAFNGDQMTLAGGSQNGLKMGQTVMAYEKEAVNNGLVLGQIVTLDPWQARVDLLTSDRLSIKAVTADGAQGFVSGDGNRVWLDKVRQADVLTTGELVLTVGGDGWLPGLVLGQVGQVEKEDTAVFQRAQVDLIVAPETVSQVFVVSD